MLMSEFPRLPFPPWNPRSRRLPPEFYYEGLGACGLSASECVILERYLAAIDRDLFIEQEIGPLDTEDSPS